MTENQRAEVDAFFEGQRSARNRLMDPSDNPYKEPGKRDAWQDGFNSIRGQGGY